MAIEVQASNHLFDHLESGPALADNPQARVRLSIQERREMRMQREKPLQTKLFLHNFLHDVESIWWIGAHSLFPTLPLSSRATEATIAPKNSFRDLLPRQATGLLRRSMFFEKQQYYDSFTDSLPEEYEHAAFLLGDCRMLMVDCYRSIEAEEDFPTPEHFAKFFNSDSFDIYLEALTLSMWENTTLEEVEFSQGSEAIADLEKINYADYDLHESDPRNCGGHKRKRKLGNPVDQNEADRTTKLPRRSRRTQASVGDETVGHKSPKTTATKRRSTRSTRPGYGMNT